MTLPPAFLDRPLAHRGLHDLAAGRAENSRKAFSAAIEGKYGIELDVQRSKDGAAMVFHDYDLGRLTHETGPIAQRTAAELAATPLKGDGDGVFTLSEVLSQINGQVPLLIEVKDQDGGMGPNVGPLEEAVAAALSDYSGPAAVMSFNPYSVDAFRKLLPDTPRGIVTCAYTSEDWPTLRADVRANLRNIPDFDQVGACFISHDRSDLEAPAVGKIKSKGHPVLCWTVKSAEEEAEARKIADNITFEQYLA